MSSISTLIASGSKKIQPKLRNVSTSVDSLITAKATVHKSATKKKAPSKVAAAPATKSMSGLQKKLDALSKKYPGVTFEIQSLKTKQNQIKVSGLGKLTQKDLYELFKKIPNTNHIPNKMAPGTAYFTLFGKKELTGAETVEAAERKMRPYYVLLESLKTGGNGWTIQFGDYDKKVVDQELKDTRDHNKGNGEKKLQYKIIKVANARQKTIEEAVKALTASEPARTTFKVN